MRHMKNIMAAFAAVATLFSCSSEDPYQAGFSFVWPTAARTDIYANTVSDTVVVDCLGDWTIVSEIPEASWCELDQTKGKGASRYKINASFTQNTTGAARLAQFRMTDVDHPDEAHATWQYLQYATRGDGSMGNASDVLQVMAADAQTGADMGHITVTYDSRHRPLTLMVRNATRTLHNMTLQWDDVEGVLSTTDNAGQTFRGNYGADSQPDALSSGSTDIGYHSQVNFNSYYEAAMSTAFTFVESRDNGEYWACSYHLGGQSLQADSIHNADSLRYRHYLSADVIRDRFLSVGYGVLPGISNRHQSLDVNQLLLGIDNCNPYLLLSLFRYARNSSVITSASSGEGSIVVTPTLDTDGLRIKTLRIQDSKDNSDIVYTFVY